MLDQVRKDGTLQMVLGQGMMIYIEGTQTDKGSVERDFVRRALFLAILMRQRRVNKD
jgi:hypothetical protein